MEKPKKVQFATKIDEKLYKQLKHSAIDDNLKLEDIMTKLVTRYLQERNKQ